VKHGRRVISALTVVVLKRLKGIQNAEFQTPLLPIGASDARKDPWQLLRGVRGGVKQRPEGLLDIAVVGADPHRKALVGEIR